MSEPKVSRLLILDDERVLVDTLCMIVNDSGYEARVAYDHDTAMAIAREFKPDFFLTGFCNCCVENGSESIAEIQTFLPECRTLLFTGTASAVPVIEDYFRRGYEFQVFAKPRHPMDFLHWMRSQGATARADAPKSDADPQQRPASGANPSRASTRRFRFFSRRNH